MLGDYRQEIKILTMKESLMNIKEYDVLIVDEADECFCNDGIMTDELDGTIIGFWDFIQRKSILMTATVDTQMQEILDRLFLIKIKDYLDFNEVLNKAHERPENSNIRFVVKRTANDHYQVLLDTIKNYHKQKPILIFAAGRKLNSMVKAKCQRLSLNYLTVMLDDDI